MDVSTLNYVLALGTIAMQVASVALLALFFMRTQPEFAGQVALVRRLSVLAAFVLAGIGSATTVIHSSLFGLAPCPLCWWQRVFMYPQVLFYLFVLWKKDVYEHALVDVSLLFSVIGAGIAAYHHVLQMYPVAGLPCPADGSVSCAQITFLEFGYVTYPMMALGLFGLLFVLMLFVKSAQQKS